jgi:hypothetical protein
LREARGKTAARFMLSPLAVHDPFAHIFAAARFSHRIALEFPGKICYHGTAIHQNERAGVKQPIRTRNMPHLSRT